MLTIELCAGAGGLSRGLKDAGFEVAIAVEVNRYAATSYRANFPHVDVIQDDVRLLDEAVFRRRLGRRADQLGALVAGLPCQGFSESNRRTRDRTNPRNQLYRYFVDLLHRLRPRWFMLENVAGIATLESGGFLQDVLGSLQSTGYRTEWRVLNAADFGVPQTRRRAFIVGNRIGVDFKFPVSAPIIAPVYVKDAIADLPMLLNGASADELPYRLPIARASEYASRLRRMGAAYVSGNSVSRNSPLVLERYTRIEPGGNWQSIPSAMMENYKDPSSCHTGIYHRLEWTSPSKVIGNFRKNMLIHPSQQRGLSIREAARLQSFPDCHVFIGPLNDRQQQVGDAVPPILAEQIGRAIGEQDRQVRGRRASVIELAPNYVVPGEPA